MLTMSLEGGLYPGRRVLTMSLEGGLYAGCRVLTMSLEGGVTADGYLVMTAVGTDVARRPIIGKSLSPWLPLRQSASRPPTIIVYLKRWERFLQCVTLLLFVLQAASTGSAPHFPEKMAGDVVC